MVCEGAYVELSGADILPLPPAHACSRLRIKKL
jgi:hypothetical protein